MDTQPRTWIRTAKPIPGNSDGRGLTFTLSSKDIEATYDRYDPLDERREVLDPWAAMLARIDLDDRSNVVGMRRPA